MKKIIISWLAIIALSSCGAPTIKNPSDALQKNQTAVIENINNFYNHYPKQWEDNGNLKVNLQDKSSNFNLDLDYKWKFQNKWKNSDYNLKANIKADLPKELQAPVSNISWQIDLDLITLTKKVYFKLNSINIDNIEKVPQLAMITGIAAPFEKKWYFLNLPEDQYSNIQKNILKNLPTIIDSLKKNTLLKFVKENKNKNFYDYDVVISKDAIINFSKETKKVAFPEDKTKQNLTKEEIDNITKSVEDFNKNVKLNIKIDKSNLKYFIFKISNKDWDFELTNTKSNFNIILNNNIDKLSAKIITKKSWNSINWTINILQNNKEIFSWNIKISISNNNFKFNLDWKIKDNQKEVNIKISLDDKTSKKSIKIEEPKEAKDFQQVIQQVVSSMMWWVNPQLQANPNFQATQNNNFPASNSGDVLNAQFPANEK